jgi:hypothetical protein
VPSGGLGLGAGVLLFYSTSVVVQRVAFIE